MKILIDYRPALHERTGVGEHIHHLAEALTARSQSEPDVSVTLFSSSWRHRLPSDAIAGAKIVDRHIPVRCLNWFWHRVQWPSIESVVGKFDVAHSPHPLSMPSRHAAHFVTIHDLDFLAHPDHVSAEIRRDYPKLVERDAARADRVIVPSRYTASIVQTQLKIPTDRIVICSNGAPLWAPRHVPIYDGHVLFVGSIEPRKNIKTLLGAYRALLGRRAHSPDLVLAGHVPRTARDILGALDSSPLDRKVRVLGYVSPLERYELYRNASMLVMPSLDEGFGLPALEAMTVGVPVIVSTRGALPEVVADAGLIVEPDDENAIQKAMARILDDRFYVNAAVARGLLRARSYDWGRSAHTLFTAYADALRERRG